MPYFERSTNFVTTDRESFELAFRELRFEDGTYASAIFKHLAVYPNRENVRLKALGFGRFEFHGTF